MDIKPALTIDPLDRIEYLCGLSEAPPAPWEESRATVRRDVARYLHDTLAQDLVVVAFALEKLRFSSNFTSCPEYEQVFDLIDKSCRHLRILNVSLHIPPMEDDSVSVALERYVKRLQQETGLDIECFSSVVEPQGSSRIFSLFLEVLQEWAAKAISDLQTSRKTTIHLVETRHGAKLDITSDCDEDSAILAVARSVFIGRRVRQLGGSAQIRRHSNGTQAIFMAEVGASV